MQQTNWYTILFAFVMTLLVAGGLASLKQGLGERQRANELLFNKQSILGSVMEVTKETDAETIFVDKVKGFFVNSKGDVVLEDTDQALLKSAPLELRKIQKLPEAEQEIPVFEFTDDEGDKQYIMPTFGGGLWGWISAYVALDSDKNTIVGVSFNHETETPGLGAEIKDNAGFYTDFVGEKIFDENGKFVSVDVKKGNGDPANNDKTDHEIDAISGATITCDGVNDMLKEDLKVYEAFLKASK